MAARDPRVEQLLEGEGRPTSVDTTTVKVEVVSPSMDQLLKGCHAPGTTPRWLCDTLPGAGLGRGYTRVMLMSDIYQPDHWNSFFILVGTGAVTLTGLVFVAMSLNLKVIVLDATHRYRAINTLTGLALVFMRCALVLMGTPTHRGVGFELFVVTCVSLFVFSRGYLRAITSGEGLRVSRIIGGSAVHLTEIVGAAMFYFNHLDGLYIAAVGMVANTCYMITAAWLLVVGVVEIEKV